MLPAQLPLPVTTRRAVITLPALALAAIGTGSVSAPTEARAADTTFSEDFSGPLNDAWWWRYSGVSGASQQEFVPSGVEVRDGNLVLTAQRAGDGKWHIAGVGSRHNQLYGAWHVRARIEKGQGTTLVVLLWPETNLWADGEIDFAEDNGDPERKTLAASYWKNGDHLGFADTDLDTTQWHTYSVVWTAEAIQIIVDGRVWHTFENHDIHQPMRLALQTEAWPERKEWQHGVSPETPDRVSMYVDWVRVETL